MLHLVRLDDLSLLYSQVPIDIFSKKWMSLDFLSTVCTEASRWIALEKPGHDTLGFCRYIGWEDKRVHEDPLVHCVHVFIIEWWETSLAMGIARVGVVSTEQGCSPSSHTKVRRVSTNRRSWCNLGSPRVLVRYILEFHRMLMTGSGCTSRSQAETAHCLSFPFQTC